MIRQNKTPLERLKARWDGKLDFDKAEYVNQHMPINVRCIRHNIWFSKTPELLRKGCTGCPVCKAEINDQHYLPTRLTQDEFIAKAKLIHGDKYDYSQVKYVTVAVPVTVICPIHGPWQVRPGNHLYASHGKAPSGCPICGQKVSNEKKRHTKESFIQRARAIHGDTYDYKKVNYVGYHRQVEIICPKHGSFWTTPDAHLKGGKCHYCACSVNELELHDVFMRMGISCIKEYRILASNTQYRYDYYLPELNMLVEYHGRQHYMPAFFNGVQGLRERLERDALKQNMAIAYGYSFISIPYDHPGTLEEYVAFLISQIYRYRVGNKYYHNFIELANAMNWGPYATAKLAKPYQVYNKKKDAPLYSNI